MNFSGHFFYFVFVCSVVESHCEIIFSVSASECGKCTLNLTTVVSR
jgi:hypothetical protein